MERNLQARDSTAWTYDDQEQALQAGFSNVADWALWIIAKEKLPAIEKRLAALEGTSTEMEET